MSIWRLLFLFKDRIGRRTFWSAALAINALFGVTIFAANELAGRVYPEGLELTGRPAMLLAAPLLAFVLLFFWTNAAVGVKRLHDRGHHGGWWILFFLSLGALSEIPIRDAGHVLRVNLNFAHTLALLVFLIGLIEIGFRRGDDGANAHGADTRLMS